MEIKRLEAEVREILTNYPEARDSNEKLYARYLSNHGIRNVAVSDFFANFLNYKVSTFASVTRTRRKLVEKFPELSPSDAKKREWLDHQYEMSDYAKGRDY